VNKNSVSPKAVVIKGSGGGGLGDRIRAALVGMLYADLSHRHVYVDWRDGVYGPNGLNAFDELFQIHQLPVVDAAHLNTRDTHPPAWSGRLHRSMDEIWNEDGNTSWNRAGAIHRYSFDLGQLDHPNQVLVMWEFDQLAALRRHLADSYDDLNDEQILAAAYNRFLLPSPSLSQAVDQCLAGCKGRTVGVHVRATREAKAQKGEIPLTAYTSELDRLLRTQTFERIVICTDNAEVERKLRERYPQSWSKRKWFAEPGESLHLNEACPDKLQAAKDALTDIMLLARCDWLISTQNSSFSMMARIMSSAPPSQQVFVGPRVRWVSRFFRRINNLIRKTE
jgi:hypothetical protein